MAENQAYTKCNRDIGANNLSGMGWGIYIYIYIYIDFINVRANIHVCCFLYHFYDVVPWHVFFSYDFAFKQ